MSDGISRTLRANWKAEGLQLVRVGVGRWCGPGHGSYPTWQAQAGQIAGGESRGNPCVLGRGEEMCGGRKSLPWRARVVVLEVCRWGPVPLLSVHTDTPLALLTYFGHRIVPYTMAFPGGHLPLGSTTRNVFHGVLLGQCQPLGISRLCLSRHSRDWGIQPVFVMCSECAGTFGSRWFLNINYLESHMRSQWNPSELTADYL